MRLPACALSRRAFMLPEACAEPPVDGVGLAADSDELRFTLFTGGFKLSQIVGPFFGLLMTQLKQIAPTVNAAVMTIGKDDLDCVMALGLQISNLNVFFAELKHSLIRGVTLHLCRRRIDSKILCWQIEAQ